MKQKQKFKDLINHIRLIKGANIPYREFANALNIQTTSVNQRLARNSYVKEEEVEIIKKYFDIHEPLLLEAPKVVPIRYYENDKLTNIIQNPLIEQLYLDVNMIKSMWRIAAENLRIIAMPGNKMENEPTNHLHIRNRDILLMDISSRDINISGIYAYETLGGTKLQISNVAVMLNGNIRFYYANTLYSDEVRTEQDLEKLDFKVVGRIIKNLSFVHS